MKEFVDTFKRVKKVTGDNVFIGVGFSILAAIVGVIVALAILYTDGKGEAYAHLGAFMVLLVMAFTIIMNGFAVFPTDFMQALSMGKTRKYLVPSHYLLWLRNTLVVLLIALILSFVEDFVYTRLFTEAVCEVNVKNFLCNPLVFVTILLCVPALILFLGGIILFFGFNFVWAFLGIYVVGTGFSYYTKAHPNSAVVSWLDGLSSVEPNVVPICLLCLLTGAVLLGLSWLMLHKQRVTF